MSYYRQLQALVMKHRNKSATIKANSKTAVLEAWLTANGIDLPGVETYHYPLTKAFKARPTLAKLTHLELFSYLVKAKEYHRPNNSQLTAKDLRDLDNRLNLV